MENNENKKENHYEINDIEDIKFDDLSIEEKELGKDDIFVEKINHTNNESSVEKKPLNQEDKKEEVVDSIPNKKEKRKYFSKDTKNGIIIAGVMIGILLMFFGALYYNTNPSQAPKNDSTPQFEVIKIGDHTFFYEDGLWNVFIYADNETKYKIQLHYNPLELKNIQIIGNGSKIFANNPKMYLAMDPNQNYTTTQYFVLASSELSRNIVGTFGKEVEGVCYKESNVNCMNRTIVDCTKNTTIPIILINESSKDYVEFITPNCVVINGNDEGIVKSAERLLYRWLALMP